MSYIHVRRAYKNSTVLKANILRSSQIKVPCYGKYAQCHLIIPMNTWTRALSTDTDGKKTPNGTEKKGSSLQSSISKGISAVVKGTYSITKSGVVASGEFIIETVKNPRSLPVKIQALYAMTKETIHHYWVGSKLLWSEMKLTTQILKRLLQGHGITRRERLQLMRTTTDMFRLVPFAVFVIVPFMELLLPVALKLFPNMLPSTFQDKLKREENMKQELQMRLAVAGFMQETLHSMVSKTNKKFTNTSDAAGAKEVIDFMEKARQGQALPKESVIRIAQLFKDELTLANIARPQLVLMCQFMGLPPYGNDALLRFQLRAKMRLVKEDDRRILWEGLDSLTKLELREACRDRGMRSVGLTLYGYKLQLREWLDLSIQKNIPISLLVMSRAFALSSVPPENVIRDSLSSMDDEVVNEVVLEAARSEEEGTVEMRTRKLESLQFQKEMIEDEFEEAEEAVLQQQKIVKKGVGVAAAAKSEELVGSRLVGANGAAVASDDKGIPPVMFGADMERIETEAKAAPLTLTERLTVAELQALGDMALTSAVEREKAELAILKSRGMQMEQEEQEEQLPPIKKIIEVHTVEGKASKKFAAADTVPVTPFLTETGAMVTSLEQQQQSVAAAKSVEGGGSGSGSGGGDAKVDKSVSNLRRALDAMLGKLEVRIETTEKALGGRLQRLDLDGDGVVDAAELKEAVLGVLKRYPSAVEADEIVKLLDRDRDGQVSVEELLEIVRVHADAKTNA
eukprot:gene6773-13722_t